MQILINEQPSPLQPEVEETLGHLFMRLEDHCHRSGLTVVSCRLDGAPLDIAAQQDVSTRPANDFDSLDIEAVTNDRLAEQTLGELKPLLEEIPAEAEAAAAALQAGRQEEAHVKIDAILQVWAVLFETLSNASRLHSFTLSEVTCDDRSVDVMANALSDLLREIQEALESRDTVTVADVLEYEISPAVPVWLRAVDAVIDHLARLRSDGAPG